MRRFEVACLAALLFASAGSFLYSREIQPAAAERPVRDARVVRRTQGDALVAHGAQGDILKLHLTAAPFPHAARQDGYSYGQVQYPLDAHYLDSSVAVFIPRGVPVDLPVNLVFFFHGWNSSIDDAAQKFDLYRQFSQSGVPAVLVVPELAVNAPDSFGGKLEEKGGFSRMVNELVTRLSAAGLIETTRVGGIVLAGHSGAFEVIGKILMHGDLAANIDEVVLFDGLYAFVGQYGRWIESGAGRFVSVIAADGEVNTDVDALMELLRSHGVAFDLSPDDPASDAQALASRVVFLASSSDHFGVVHDHDEFRRILSVNTVFER